VMSPLSARKAEALGYTNLKVFTTGLPAWKKDSNVVVTSPEHVMGMIEKDIAHVLVDLRAPKAAEAGHIKGAVNIPADKLAGARDMFPSRMDAPVILYTDEGYDASAFATVRGWGYKNASLLEGGARGWEPAGGRLFAGKTEAKIVYEPKPLPGTITGEEFAKVVETKPADKVILDVRDADEVMAGKLPGAVHIPVGELAERMAELPTDKEILIHCTTGIRAMMAHDALAKKGYRARYLNEVIQVASDGSFEIAK
jgi:rhodanese-related sulfurtransferase